MFKRLIKTFFRWFYKVKPPEMVKYGQEGGYARGKITKVPDGSVQMQIQGEKYPFPGHPRGHVLLSGSLERMKSKLKKQIFHAIFEAVQESAPDMLPEEQLCPFVKEIWRTMSMLEEAEITQDMKSQVRNMKKALCFFLQEDDAWRFRAQMVMQWMHRNKFKLSKADRYYARGKWLRPDKFTKRGTPKYDY